MSFTAASLEQLEEDLLIKKLIEPHFRATHITVEWKIKNFFKLLDKEHFIDSPVFKISFSEWFVRIYPNGSAHNKSVGWVFLCLFKKSSLIPDYADCTIGIKNSTGESAFKSNEQVLFDKHKNVWETKLVRRSTLVQSKDSVAPYGELTFFCTIHIEDVAIVTDVYSMPSFADFLSSVSCPNKSPGLQKKNSDGGSQSPHLVHPSKISPSLQKKDLDRDSQSPHPGHQSRISFGLKKKESDKGRPAVRSVGCCDKLISLQKNNLERGVEKFSQDVKALFLSGYKGDVTVKVKDKEFVAHKSVLGARSTVFLSMFEFDMTEKSSDDVIITDCEPELFEDFLLFVYTGKADIVSSKNAIELYVLADKYNITDLKLACSECMANTVSVDSVFDVVHLAVLYNEAQLLNTASDFFVNNASSILKTSKWLSFLAENLNLANEMLIKMANKPK